MTRTVRVLIVDDDPMVRAGLSMMLDGADGIAVVGEAADGDEVPAAVARGRANAEIAADLFVGLATVKAHVSTVLAKLGLDNRTQIALLAHDAGLT